MSLPYPILPLWLDIQDHLKIHRLWLSLQQFFHDVVKLILAKVNINISNIGWTKNPKHLEMSGIIDWSYIQPDLLCNCNVQLQ